MIRDDVCYPTKNIGNRTYMSKYAYYSDDDIERLKESLEENDLTFEITSDKQYKHFFDKSDAMLYDIRLIFKDDADEAFYQVLISELV